MRFARRLALCVAVIAISLAPGRAQAPQESRVIMISIDGLMPSSYRDPASPATNLRALAQSGVWADGVIGVLPTVTFPSHTTLITGVEPALHGVFDNRIFDPENRSEGAWYYYARDITATTLPAAVHARGMRAAAVTWPVTVGMDIDYLVPEYLRSDHPEGLTLLRALSTPRTLLDAVERSRGKPLAWPQDDRDRTDITKYILQTFDPHLLLLHLIELDDAQHTFGPGAPEARATLVRIDAMVGEIVAQVKQSGRTDQTTIAIVSDHGFLPVATMLQPNALFKREGLLKVDERGRVTEWQAYFHSSGGSGYVYVKDRSLVSRVQSLLTTLKQDPANGIRSLWTRADLEARGSHPDAAFGFDMVDGFYTGGGHDALLARSGSKGGHGFEPERPALHASLIMAGPAVRARGSLGVVRMTQIAPTVGSILGVKLSTAAGRPLTLQAAAASASK
jgi:predicted AlkP superfamily pyrophosphatase or phosphodiesterase